MNRHKEATLNRSLTEHSSEGRAQLLEDGSECYQVGVLMQAQPHAN